MKVLGFSTCPRVHAVNDWVFGSLAFVILAKILESICLSNISTLRVQGVSHVI